MIAQAAHAKITTKREIFFIMRINYKIVEKYSKEIPHGSAGSPTLNWHDMQRALCTQFIPRGQTKLLFRGLLVGVYALRRNVQHREKRTLRKCPDPAIESCGS